MNNDSTRKTSAEAARKPALPCPPWCNRHHDGEFAGTSHQLHRDFSDGDGYVTLYMEDYGTARPTRADVNGDVSISVTWRDPDRSVIRPLAEAEQFAETAEAFGRPDVAALIRELAAMAEARAREDEAPPFEACTQPCCAPDAAQPEDIPVAAACRWCATTEGILLQFGALDDGSPRWFCGDVKACYERRPVDCPEGCGCRLGTDDAGRLECGCDGPCAGDDQREDIPQDVDGAK